MTTKTSTTDLPHLSALRERLRGRVITPNDADYDDARRVYNAAHDQRRPALIVRAVDPEDVAVAVSHARDNDLLLAVRGGGHSIAGYSTCDDGMVLDLVGLRKVRVDAAARTARAEGGCTWADLDQAAHAVGLATTGGLVSSTGIAGLTLGGGIGFLARRCGLACDNVVSADVVTADGRSITCDAGAEPELFWALRGGGGNFGVVTSLSYRLHPIDTVLGGPTVYPLDAEVLRAYDALVTESPAELGAVLSLALGPPLPFLPERWHGRPVAIVLTCWSGPVTQDDDVRGLLSRIGPVLGQQLGRMPYPVMNTLLDAALPTGLHHYWRSAFADGLDEAAIAVHLDYARTIPTLETATLLFPIDRACHEPPPGGNAFPVRDATFAVALGPTWRDPAESAAHVAWGRRYAAALAPHTRGNGYGNLNVVDSATEVRADYGASYERLVAAKRHYDPKNLFRRNHNIAPA